MCMNDQSIITELRKVQALLVVLVLLVCFQVARGGDRELALADRSQFAPESWPSLYYVSLEAVAKHEDVATALNLVIPSTSRQVVLERCLPVQLSATLYRLNLEDLGWSHTTWREIIASHPYSTTANPLVLRGDWLLLQLCDTQESKAYYSLLFGTETDRENILGSLGVDPSKSRRFGMIEGQSGVNVQGKRWIENRPRPRGYAWITRDSIRLDNESDMLERPDGSFKHDGEEVIVGLRKVHMATGTQGALQVYFLANGNGKLVTRAPVDLVQDSTAFRGFTEIRAPGSCIQCHENGLNPLKKNELRDYIGSGVDAYANFENQQSLEAFHFADLSKELTRNSEDFQTMVRLATGVEPEEAVKSFRVAVGRYDRPLSLDEAASELRTAPDELKLALAWASAHHLPLSARLAGLAHGKSISRTAWEQAYLVARDIHQQWSQNR